MDAAIKFIRTTALLTLVALLMAAPGFAQTPVLQVPLTVSLSGTAGQTVNVTSSTSTQIPYTIGTPTYTDDNGGFTVQWLGVTGGTTTPAVLSFNLVTAAGLTQGTHQATVKLTPTDTAIAPVTITVTYTSGTSGGGGSGTLVSNVNPINLNAASGSQTFTTIAISTTSAAALNIGVTWSVTTGGTQWLAATITGATSVASGSPTSILVTADGTNLGNGIYQGTVTVTPSAGTALVIPVNFTVGTGGTGGSGSWTVTPSSVPFSFSTNSGLFPSATFTVTTTSGDTIYNAAATSSNGWLLISGSPVQNGLSVGTAYTLSIGSQANALDTGTYQGSVTIKDVNSGNTQATINVTLSVNGGNSTGLIINPNPLTVNSAVNGVQQNPSVTVTSSTGGTLSISSSSAPTWLSYQLPGNTTVTAGGSTAFTVNVNPAGMGVGSYSGSLGISVGAQAGTLNVSLVIGGGGTGVTTVAPASLSFAYQQGTLPSAIAQQKIIFTGQAGSWSSTITTNDGGTWLKLSPSSGNSLPDPSISSTVPVAYIDPTGLAVGSYTGDIAITAGGGTQHVTVSLTVTAGAVLVPTPGDLVFVAQTGTANPPGQHVFFNITDISVTPNNTWISVTATGSSMLVSVDPTGLAAGVYNGSITVVQNSVTNTPYTYPVVMVVNGGGSGGGSLTFVPSSLSFTSINGVTSPLSATLTVSANVSTGFTYSSSVSGGISNWISISPANSGSGTTTANLSVSVNPSGLSVGTYNGTITFNASNFNQTVPVTLTVSTSGGTGGNVTVNPTSLTFTGDLGSGSLSAQSITISSASGTASVPFTVTPSTASGGTWLSTSANASNSTPSSITVMANASGLSAGTYTGNLAVKPTGGSLINVPVTMNITAPPAISATPTQLTFTYRAGDSLPAAQVLTIAGSGLTYSATAVSNGNWLVVSPATGTAPGAVNVSISPASLAAGTYNGTVTVAGTNGAAGSTTVNVSLTVTAPLPTITKVTNAASYAEGTIAPGEIITLFAGDPTHPIGPTTPAGLTLDSSGKVATTIGGVQVLINGFAAPMVYASATQVSAVVPYELALFTNATVQAKFLGQTSNGVAVNVATTAPGVFTLNSSGTGPGAILNSNNSTNGPGTGATTPATRGDTVVVYMTGEGQTSPPGVTGKVTTVASAPPLTPGPLLPVSVKVGGQPANWSFAGEAPGFVSGVMQLNVQLPTNIGTGEQEIIVTIGGKDSQRGVTVSVK